MKIRYRGIILLFAFFLCSNISYAQETAKPVEVNGDQVEYFPKEKKVVGKGNVSVDYRDILLTCDKITVYTETRDADAEGNVVLKSPTGEVRGGKIRYNFETKKGEIVKVKVKSGNWYSGGEKAELFSDYSMRINNGYITSCDLERPHYKISAKNIVIYPNNKVVAKNVTLKAGNVPVAFLPRYDYSMDTDWPTFDVIPGKKSKWGAFALTSYRYEVNENNKFTLRLDEREHWGLGEGLDYRYTTDGIGSGIIRTYHTSQRDRDRGELLKGEEDRYRVQLRHYWDVKDDIYAIAEYHKLSDNEMTKDFFYREEYDRESSPESYLYVLNRQPEYSLSFLTRKRVNRFQTVTEQLPELKWNLKDQRLLDLPIYYKSAMTFTNLNSKTGNSATDGDVIRFDSFDKLSSPLRLANFLSISPFVGLRETYYSKDINGDEDKYRTAFYTGIDTSAKFFKTYDVSGRFLGIELNELRHIITPTLEYEYIHEPSTTSGAFQQFDDIDSVARKSTFSMGFQNKFQTKRIIDGKKTSVDLGYVLFTGDYLYKPEDGSRFSDVRGELEFTPYKWVRVESDTLYDPATRDFQNWNADLYIHKDKDTRLGFGSRYWQNSEHELTSELWYRLNNEWAFRVFGRFDLKEVEPNGHKIINRFDGKEITIVKDLHCWIAEVSLSEDRDGGTTAWVSFKLKASPKVPFDFKNYYARPK